MNIIVITATRILSALFLVMNNRIVLHATAKKSTNSCLPAAFSAREAMVKRSRRLHRIHLAVDVQPPVVRAVVNDRQNN
ncbi:MAG: hypothetical protein BBJ57_13995 [Desulfobacterales bacterium PC51MH44]|nr:MAG: hypothetical protein BBJ57_13995 [Desulfobacterales bacterium PC51MH44]